MVAVGTNVAPTNLFINLFGGMAIGANVVLAKYIGAKKEDKISDVLHGVIFMAISVGIILCIIGQFIAYYHGCTS